MIVLSNIYFSSPDKTVNVSDRARRYFYTLSIIIIIGMDVSSSLPSELMMPVFRVGRVYLIFSGG